MKIASSLFAKILAWFFLNLLLLTAVLVVFFAVQLQMNLHEFFGHQGANRLRSAGMLITHDLEQAPPDEWPDILARHAQIHGVDFLLVLQEGIVFSPNKEKVPETVLVKAKEILQRHGPQEGPEDCAGKPPELRGKRPHLIIHSTDPSRWWFGIRVPIFLEASERHLPAMLLVSSASITGNGFFFDPLPWMVVAAAVIVISVLFWLPMIRSITNPLVRMTRAAEEIAKGNFAVSIHEPRADEIGRLASTINHMTARLAAFVQGQKRFLGDVSHELGSPVARIQFGLGILEQRLESANRERVRDVMEDVDHMAALIGELLAFSRAEMKSQAVKLERIALLPLVQTAVRREADDAKIQVHVVPDLHVTASAELLTRAIANLLRNAVKYAGTSGSITVTAQEQSGQVEITVADCGPGVAEEHLDRLFEPFFRPEPSRDRDSGGVGLGLAIVKTCVESCGGTVAAHNLQPQGFMVTVKLKG
ncbi:MAG: two-component system, OmpR family, sensor histidine kinase CpxA [Candidatus Electronema aureum]|uniref:histidine kinase n=1 Tax=Candidatus Electronema aureum TaxID=2005002 RepID=A0A521G4U3_9BACT|nr:MAG: two-component system, OmpR family, sensor histidine kinase CpxA [Candidatus Electronema aureum]